MENIQLLNISDNTQAANELADKYDFVLTDSPSRNFYLELSDEALQLKKPSDKSSVMVDFTSSKALKRINEQGILKQDMIKAVGLNKSKDLSIIDATAGLGRDSFILASITTKNVLMLERNPIANSLLADGLKRLAQISDNEQLKAISDKLALEYTNSMEYLKNKENIVDVIYLDPMFNSGKAQKAAVKKEMAFFQANIGDDLDSDQLLELALKAAKKRVVVKRHKNSPFLNNHKPSHSFVGKTNRFDVYFLDL